MTRAVRLTMALLLVAATATGCLSGDIDVTVRDDGSGEVRLEVFPSAQLQTVLDAVDVSSLADTYLDGIDGASFEEIERDDRDGYLVVVPFDDYGELTSVLVDGATIVGQQIRLFSSIDLRQIDGGWRLDAVLAPEITSNTLTAPPELDDLIETDGRVALGSGLDLSISLPGEVTTTNADETDGGTATWRLEELDGDTELRMVTEPRSFPTPLQKVLAIAGAAVLLGVLLASWGTRRSRRSDSRRRVRSHSQVPADADAAWRRPVAPFAPPTSSAPAPPVPERALPLLDMSPAAAPEEAASPPDPPAPPDPPLQPG